MINFFKKIKNFFIWYNSIENKEYKNIELFGLADTTANDSGNAVLLASSPNWKYRRLSMGMTQKDLAKRAKVSVSTVQMIERDWKMVGLGSVYKVAEALGINLATPKLVKNDDFSNSEVIIV